MIFKPKKFAAETKYSSPNKTNKSIASHNNPTDGPIVNKRIKKSSPRIVRKGVTVGAQDGAKDEKNPSPAPITKKHAPKPPEEKVIKDRVASLPANPKNYKTVRT